MHKHLGKFSNDDTWHNHINYIKENAVRELKFQLDLRSLEIIYTSYIRPILEYCNENWDNCTQYEKDDIEKIQKEAARIATGTTELVSTENFYGKLDGKTLDSRRKKQKLILLYKIIKNLTPQYLSSLIPATVRDTSSYNLRK